MKEPLHRAIAHAGAIAFWPHFSTARTLLSGQAVVERKGGMGLMNAWELFVVASAMAPPVAVAVLLVLFFEWRAAYARRIVADEVREHELMRAA